MKLIAIHAVLYILLTGVLSTSLNISDLKQQIIDQLGGHASSLRVNLELFGNVIRFANGSGAVDGSIYQSLLFVFSSLAFIWTIRELKAGKSFAARIAYYRGQYQIVPFIMVLLAIGAQLIPFALANWLLAILTSDTVAVHAGERIAAWIVWALVSLPTFYMLSASIMALYIVTLPDTMPMQALRKARELAKYRRWLILRRLLSLAVAVVIIVSALVLVTIYLVPVLATLVTVLLMVAVLPFVHIYLYNLYRSLL